MVLLPAPRPASTEPEGTRHCPASWLWPTRAPPLAVPNPLPGYSLQPALRRPPGHHVGHKHRPARPVTAAGDRNAEAPAGILQGNRRQSELWLPSRAKAPRGDRPATATAISTPRGRRPHLADGGRVLLPDGQLLHVQHLAERERGQWAWGPSTSAGVCGGPQPSRRGAPV